MFMTWLVTSTLFGEIILFLVMSVIHRRWWQSAGPGWFYFVLCLGLFSLSGTSFFAYVETLKRIDGLIDIRTRQHAVVDLIEGLKDMETGQRGYLLTGEEAYLEHYRRNLGLFPDQVAAVRREYRDNAQRALAENLCQLAVVKSAEMHATVELRREGRKDDAVSRVLSGQGRSTMDLARLAADDLSRRNDSQYEATNSDLRAVAKARIGLALLLAAGAVVQMVLGNLVGWSLLMRPATGQASSQAV